MAGGALVAELAVAALLAAIGTYAIRGPRLALDVSLRGGTRAGKLYVVVTNRGHLAAKGARVEVAWAGANGRRAIAATQELGAIPARDALRIEVDRLHAAIRDDPDGWDRIEVRLRAWNAIPARTVLSIQSKGKDEDKEQGEGPVRYAGKDIPCPMSPDGRHEFEARRIMNDGVVETWHACRRCRHVVRDPLTDAEKAIQARVRAARAERARAEMEAEFARRAAEEAAQPRARGTSGAGTWRHVHDEREPARDEDTLPPDMAFFILELDPARASWQDVLAAHRRLALAHHPDRAAPGERAAAERRMQEINAARDRLREHFGHS